MARPTSPLDRVLLHLKDSRRVVIGPSDVYYLEASGDETIVRRRGRKTLREVRSLGEVMPAFEPCHFHSHPRHVGGEPPSNPGDPPST